MAGISSVLGNKPQTYQQFSRYNPEVQQGVNALTQRGFNQQQNTAFDFAPHEEEIRKNYASKTIPSIARRFLSGDTSNSSGFQNALTESAKGLDYGINSLKENYNDRGFQQLMQLIQGGEPNNYLTEEEPGAGEGLSSAFASQALPIFLKILEKKYGNGSDTGIDTTGIGGGDTGGDQGYNNEFVNTAADWAPGAGGTIGATLGAAGGPLGSAGGGAVGTGIGLLLQLMAKYFNKKGSSNQQPNKYDPTGNQPSYNPAGNRGFNPTAPKL
jgi:hypothetical protein